MGVSLQKGQKIDLTKTNPNLQKVVVGLGWDTNRYDGQHAFDLDVSVFLLNADGKVRNDQDFIYYNQLIGGNGSVVHNGDNRTGAGDGDDETINVDLNAVPTDVSRIAFTVTIDQAVERNQNFGQVCNAYIHIMNEETGEELIRYDLGEDFSIENAVVSGELYRHNDDWKFNAIGSGFEGGLLALCNAYGVQVG